jgi:hypothetical protein
MDQSPQRYGNYFGFLAAGKSASAHGTLYGFSIYFKPDWLLENINI